MSVPLFKLGRGLVTIPSVLYSVLYSGSIAVLLLFDEQILCRVFSSKVLLITIVAIGCVGAMEELQSVMDEVACYATIGIRIEDEAIKQKITGVLQTGSVDLMLEGIEGWGQHVRVNRVSPELVSLSARAIRTGIVA